MVPATPTSVVARESLAAVFARTRTRLGGFIRRRVANQEEADDILQEVFRELVEAYRLPAPIEEVSAWLYRVARNRIIDRFRKKKEVTASEANADILGAAGDYQLDLALPAMEAGPEAAYARWALLDALEKALAELPDEQRETFLAHEIRGSSFKDMSRTSGVPINTLLARKRYAVLFLRERLRAAYDDLEN
jgi:RNA polymerase sigma factor (sigma-70 family)